ncbi:MAG TPA: prepilin-type N-terminal cleavage/methylation domain-containing protein [Pseudonocardiaceae bacterium]
MHALNSDLKEVTALRQRIRAAGRTDGGFTLIELLIVIVILGILSGVVVFAVQGVNNRGEQAACLANKTSVATAAEAYYAKNNSYPPDIAAMTVAPDKFLQSVPAGITYTPAGGPPATSYTVSGGTVC